MNKFLFFLLLEVASVEAQAADPPTMPENSRPVSAKAAALGLDQLLDLAFERNPDLQAAQERIGQAEAQVAEATAAFYPRLTGAVGDRKSVV